MRSDLAAMADTLAKIGLKEEPISGEPKQTEAVVFGLGVYGISNTVFVVKQYSWPANPKIRVSLHIEEQGDFSEMWLHDLSGSGWDLRGNALQICRSALAGLEQAFGSARVESNADVDPGSWGGHPWR